MRDEQDFFDEIDRQVERSGQSWEAIEGAMIPVLRRHIERLMDQRETCGREVDDALELCERLESLCAQISERRKAADA